MTAWPTFVPLLALIIPLTFGLGAAIVPRHAPLRQVAAVCTLAAGLAAVVVTGRLLSPEAAVGTGVAHVVRLDAVSLVMLGLVCTLAVVVARYSRSSLGRDPRAPRYGRALLATLGAVTTVVLADDLVVLAGAWIATSFALHQLLTFFRERTGAIVAAHEKFLLSRLADACVLVALALLGHAVGSLHLAEIHAWARAQAVLPPPVQVAAVLLVVAVCLKSAQLPFHGWLTRVMEAPTPVSALLHAGIVNIGGLLMIRLAPLMAKAPVAQTLLVIVGTSTAVVAALVMTTRPTVKASLAWSTCAQMGLMLVQCGLGAWHLALLHLVAHSLYKAHAFLGSGGAVATWRALAMAPRRAPVSVPWVLAAAVVGVAAVLGIGVGVDAALDGAASSASRWPLALLLGASLAPFLTRAAGGGWRPLVIAVAIGLGVAVLYTGWHALARGVLVLPEASTATRVSQLVVGVGFTLLFGLQLLLQARPDGALARGLGPRLFAGLYLDGAFTRLTFRVWPPKLPPSPAGARRRPFSEIVET